MQNAKLHTTTCPGSPPETEHYRFGADGNMRMYSYDRLFYSLYGYDGGTTRTYKYSFDLSPQWVNGRLEAVNFNMHTAMFYPNSYLNFNQDGHYTKHYYNGMERIASRLGDQNLSISTHDPELQDRKNWQDSLIRKSVVEITGYEFLPVGEEPDPDNPKPHYDLPHIGVAGLQPSADGIYYYHTNHLGSTCYVTDDNTSVVQGFLYAPFGEITNEHNSSFGNNVLPKYSFNAKELDEETGMYYYEARYMAPPVFISRDPLFEKYPTFSPYAYCANNPVNVIDPTGEEIVIVGDEFYQTKVKEYLNKLSKSGKAGNFLVKKAIASKKTFVIANTKADVPMELSENKSATILPFNLSKASGTYDKNEGNVPYTAVTTLAHELAHFIFPQKGSLLNDRGENTHIRAGEVLAVEWENRVRKDLNMEERKSYGGLDVYRKEIVESAKYKGYYNMRNKSNYGNNSYSVPNYKSPSFILELRQAYHIGGKYIDRLLVKPSYRHQLRIKFKT